MKIEIIAFLVRWLPTFANIIFFLGVFHFIYEGIILPQIRTELRYKLFALRDLLRRLKIENPGECDGHTFMLLQESLNNGIQIIPFSSLWLLYRVKRVLADNPQLKSRIEYRAELLSACENPTIKMIRTKQQHLFIFAIIANNGGLIPYLLPIAIVLITIAFSSRKDEVTYHQMVAIQNMPESEMKKFVPSISDSHLAPA